MKHLVDVIVLDVKMPDMDGIETLKEIKKLRPSVEVIMLTGHANVEVAIQGMELGAFDYLMKPMDIDELLYKLRMLIRKSGVPKRTKSADYPTLWRSHRADLEDASQGLSSMGIMPAKLLQMPKASASY